MRLLRSSQRVRRVLLTTDAVGGVWTHALDMARGLSAWGVEIFLAVLGPYPSQAQLGEARSISSVHLIETDLQLDWLAKSESELLGTARSLTDLALAARVDVAHLHAPALAGGQRWPLPLVVTAHSCVGTWWQAVREGPLPSDLEWQVSATRAGLRCADRVIAPSRSFARALAHYYGCARIDVILNGRAALTVDASTTSPRSGAIAAGRLWDPAKGAATLDAAAKLSSVQLAAAGPLTGPNGETVRLSQLEHLGSLAPVELARRLRGAAMFASAAVYEPFGLAVLEAAQAGAALVLSDIPTHRELWDGAATFFPVRRGDCLAAELDRLGADGELRQELGRAAQVRARRYSVASMSRATFAIYEQAASRSRQRHSSENPERAGVL